MKDKILELYAEVVRTFDTQCQTSSDASYHWNTGVSYEEHGYNVNITFKDEVTITIMDSTEYTESDYKKIYYLIGYATVNKIRVVYPC